MFDCLPFFHLDNNELLALFQDSQPNVNLSATQLNSLLADLSNSDLYNNLKNENLSIENFNQNLSTQEFDLRCLHINIHSLNAKLDDFIQLIASLDVCFDVICLTEVWSTNLQFHACVLQDYNFYYDLPKSSIVGGVGIFINKSIQCKIRNDLYIKSNLNNMIENLWFEISKSGCKFIIGCIYRHPNSCVADFIKLLETTLSKINKRKLPCVLMADMNMDILKVCSSSSVRDYINCLVSNNFLPTLLLPTRVTCTSSTLIDYICLFNNIHNVKTKICCGNILSDIFDHYPNFWLLKINKYIDMSNRSHTRVFTPKNKDDFNQKLNHMDWYTIFNNTTDVNLCYDYFINQSTIIYNQCFPLVRISRKAYKNKSWFTKQLRHLLYEKNSLFRNWRKSADEKDRLIYISFKKKYNNTCRLSKITYYKNVLDVKASSTKKIWDNLNSLMGFRTKSCNPNEI